MTVTVNRRAIGVYKSHFYDLALDYGADDTGVTDCASLLQQAINDANSAGGGTVYIPKGTYKVLSAITPKQGVLVQGAPWMWTDADGEVTGGTILQGDGTAECFKYVPTTYSSQPANGQVQADACWQFHLDSLALDNFTYGIRAGSLYNTGFFQSTFKNILVTRHSVWGVYFENCSQSEWDHIIVRAAASGVTGDMYFGASHTNFTHGNSVYRWLYARSNQPLQRCMVFQTRAGASLNQIDVNHPLGVSYGTSVYSSQTATLTNSSTTVAVTDGTKFKVDEPVGFTTAPGGGYGSSPYQIFFVTSIDGNNLTLSNMQRGANISYTGSTGDYTIRSFGFPGIEVSGLETDNDPDGTADSGFQSITIRNIDVENAGGCQLLLQNARVNAEISTTTLPFTGQNVQYLQNLCVRQSKGWWNSAEAINVDIDSGTQPFFATGGYIYSWVNQSPLGIYFDNSISQMVINLSDSLSNAKRTLTEQKVSGKMFTYPGNSMGQRQWYSSSTSLTLTAAYAGTICFAGSSAGTWTLPTLVSGQGGLATGSTAGMVFHIVNDSSGAGADLVVQAGGTDKIGFRGSTNTQITLNQGDSVKLVACWVAASSVYWAIEANEGGVLA